MNLKCIGFLLLIKAVAGGGGKGIPSLETAKNLNINLSQLAKKPYKPFGNADVHMELSIQPNILKFKF